MMIQQVVNFIKAPFSRSFGVAYAFTLPSVLLLPLLPDLIFFLSDLSENYENLSGKNEVREFINSFLLNLNLSHVFMAIVGLGLSSMLLNGYTVGLIHKMITENHDVYETKKIQLSFPFISLAVIKNLGASLVSCILCLLPILIWAGVVDRGIHAVKNLNVGIVSILIMIAVIVSFFILLYKLICYLFTANLFFLRTLKISSLIEYRKVRAFFKANREYVFIAYLLTWVGWEILGVLFSVSLSLAVSVVFGMKYHWIVLIFGLLLFNFFWTYLTLLYGIFYGKVVLWVNKSAEEKNA